MEREQYNQSILEYEDVRAACDFHKREGWAAGREEGILQGIEKGRAKGWMEGVTELCVNMVLLGYSDDAIAAVTKLPLERIEQLRHCEDE